MANYATNILFVRTDNQNDLNRIGEFLDENFCDSMYERGNEHIGGEFYSKWEYPEKEINELVASLEDKDKTYIRILTYELSSEYVSFRIFSEGKWIVKL